MSEDKYLAPYKGLNGRAARLLACEYADRVLHLCSDPRAHAAIEAARAYAVDEVTRDALEVARQTATQAVHDADDYAASDPDWAEENCPAWNFAVRAAAATTRADAMDAALTASVYGVFAAVEGADGGSDPHHPIWAAIRAAVDAQEKAWQASRLAEYLNR